MNEDGSSGDTEAAPSDESRVERLLRPFVDDALLWPVTFVIIAHAVAFLTPVVVMGLRDRRPMFLLALSVLIMLTGLRLVEEFRRGRLGVIGGSLIALWSFTGGAAWLTAHYGLF